MNSTSPSPLFVRSLLLTVSLYASAGTGTAQCALVGEAIAHVPDADGAVYASAAWDPDGGGPELPVVVLGGAFQVLGDAASPGLALYEPNSRQARALGTGIVGAASPLPSIAAIAVLPNNDLVVAGQFTGIDGVAAANVARWDGTAWQPMGGGLPFVAAALTVLPNGDVVAGGNTPPGSGDRVLRWNGAAWLPLAGLVGGVSALVTMPNGDLVAGGLGLIGITNLVRWDGAAWSTFAGDTNGKVTALMLLPGGDLIAAGWFSVAGGVSASGIARWNGTIWSAFGTGLSNPAFALSRLPNGDILVGGLFLLAGGVEVNKVAVWNGASWSGMAGGLDPTGINQADPVQTVYGVANGDVIVGGQFRSADLDKDYVARWNGSAWLPVCQGTGGSVLSSASAANGDLIVAGTFTSIEGVPANRVARRSGGVWQPLGAGLDGAGHSVLVLPNGDIVVGGNFGSAGGVAANCVARWDGAAWQALGGGLPGTVQDLELHPSGQILAAGLFLDRFAVWDGVAWSGTGVAASTPGFLLITRNLVTTSGGDVLACLGTTVGRWTGTAWQTITSAIPPLVQGFEGPMAVLSNGDLVVMRGGKPYRWNGAAWATTLSSAPFIAASLLALPDGDLLAGSVMPSPAPAPGPRFARWDGVAWTVIGVPTIGSVAHLRWLGNGRVLAAGSFTRLIDEAAGGLAEVISTCPATVASVGSGCTGSGGSNLLTATSLPWIDATFTSVATGMPANGVAIEVFGLGATSIAINTLLPQGGTGCVLSTTPDLLLLHVPLAGELQLALSVPNTPTLVGSAWWQQVVPFEFDAQGGIVAVTATNSQQLSFGAF